MGTQDIAALAIPGLVDIAEIGGSHTLLRAREQVGNRTVAVRLFDVEADDQFEYAVLALEALSQHPHAVTVYGSGSWANGRGCVLLELVEEGSLGEWIAANGRLPCAEVLDVTLKIAGALETAHRAGVVHGDLRAERVLVSASGEPQLAGLDRAVFRYVKAAIEGSGLPLVSDDVQGLGAMMLTLLAVSPSDGFPEAALECCQIPPSLQSLIRRCLDSDPIARPVSVQDLAVAIQEVQAELGLTSIPLLVDEAAADEAREALGEATVSPSEPVPVPAVVEAIPAPEPQPAASLPTLSSPPHRWRGRRRLAAGLVALAGAGAAITPRISGAPVSDERAAPKAAQLVLEDQPLSNTTAVYKGFRAVTDETGRLSMIVPQEWHMLASSPWKLGDQTVGRQLEASLANQGGLSSPGAVLALSDTLGRDRTVGQVLDELRIADGVCRHARREPFDDNLYIGAIDSYTGCGAAGADIEILVATPAGSDRIVMLRIIRLSPRDVTARNRAVDTFTVRGA